VRGGRYIVGLDIGTTKVCAAVGRAEGRKAEDIACGVAPSGGMRKGAVVDMDAAAESIRAAVKEAESLSGLSIKAAYVGIGGDHIQCIRSFGAVGVKGKRVRDKDIDRAVDSASTVYLPLDREVVHIVPSDFVIDGQDGIMRPAGMSGVRLEVKVSIITASHSAVENLTGCCEKAGVKAVGMVLGPLAASKAALGPEELETGAVLIDIGGETTSIAVFKEGRLKHAGGIPVGGSHLTNDIAIGLRVSQREAERLKRAYGLAVLPEGAKETGAESPRGGTATPQWATSPRGGTATPQWATSPRDIVETSGINGEQRMVPLSHIAGIIRPRCMEIFELLRNEIKDWMLYTAVLAGGTSQVRGMERVAEAVLGMPARTAAPMHPTAHGLVLYGAEAESRDCIRRDIIGRVLGRWKNISVIKGSLRYLTTKI